MSDRQLIADLLSALEYHTEQTRPIEFSRVAIEAAREYLRKPAQQQEPFGYFRYDFRLDAWVQNREGRPGTAFYTSPQPSKPWVGLTAAEVKHEWEVWRANIPRYIGFAKGIEAKLKEKNNG